MAKLGFRRDGRQKQVWNYRGWRIRGYHNREWQPPFRAWKGHENRNIQALKGINGFIRRDREWERNKLGFASIHIGPWVDFKSVEKKFWRPKLVSPKQQAKKNPNFDPKKEEIDLVPLWIKLYNLPHEYWDIETLKLIGDKLGGFLKADEALEVDEYNMYARICIQWQVAHPLPQYIELQSGEGVWRQPVEVEDLIDAYALCKKKGHLETECQSTAKGKNLF
ncbi:hypothetical protein SUGI_1191560 [Cryptomeria japonica]|nr:hypothetical protein SUGI_1191560 [Cryptomeria japonica]